MEIISFEKRTFEEIAAKLDRFVQRVESLCREHGGKETGEWMDNHDVCRRLRISPRTLQTLRDNGTLAFTKIGNRTYYRPDDVERVVGNVEEKRKEARKLLEKRQPSAYSDELLTDKEVAYLLKVSRRTLQDYRNNGILPYTQVGGKILYRASDIEKTLMKGYKEAYRLNE